MTRNTSAPHLWAQWLRSEASEHPRGNFARILPGSFDIVANHMARILPDNADDQAKSDCVFDYLKRHPEHTRQHVNFADLKKLSGSEKLAYANEGSVPPSARRGDY